jgi:hypothetical protein
MSDKCDVCGRDDGWHDLRTHAWQGQTQAPLLRSMLDDGSTWSVEPEAHMMSAPITVGVDYGSAACDQSCMVTRIGDQIVSVEYGTAPITVRESERQHVSDDAAAAMTYDADSRDAVERAFRKRGTVLLTVAERDALRAEVEQCHKDARLSADMLGDALAEIERLRKGKDETLDTKPIRQETGMAQTLMRAGRAGAADLVLDPRLGTPQPDGAPCEPMSARRWRWLP